ncbi:hypothetical protein GCM10010967_36330 [Dyadobacter beijingensis]|uniref:Uncharacterized protein n=2 Tax=Dyadobacter beijingensis TaxID=365489 RepID=A0ABQ2I5F3_9BACT|nr:hypothetical protein GCM10010967_36330 [Dyadobacter beijingensis]
MVMRKEKWLVWGIVLILIQMVACERSKMEENAPAPVSARTGVDSLGADSTHTDSTGTDSTAVPDSLTRRIYTEKTTGIEQKFPAVFTLINGKSPFVKWRVLPQEVTHNKGIKTTIYFQKAGKYRVLAIDSLSNDTTFIDVQVSDQVYQLPASEKPLAANDVLNVAPVAFGDTVENMIGLKFATVQSYPCSQNYLSAVWSKIGNSYQIKIGKTLTGARCYSPEKSPGTGFQSIYNIPADFSGTVEIHFNDQVYTGTMTRKGKSGYTFEWPYQTGVVFTKKEL